MHSPSEVKALVMLGFPPGRGATGAVLALLLTTTPACSSRQPPPGSVTIATSADTTDLLRIADQYRTEALDRRRFTHAEFWQAVGPSLKAPELRTEAIGTSLNGREIRAISFGHGRQTVLLWSQMHGDEATATMALADIFRYLAQGSGELRDRLARELSITFVPLLNPDGAELFQRENAAGIDINRDARRLVTPEGQALKQLHDRLRPAFGFNLHDQSARTRVGPDGPQAAIALLAPAYDEARSYNPVRQRARLVAATLAGLFGRELPGRVSKYDDDFNPRAFGDLMQQWGTSTVLIESGALADDPDKQQLRRLHVAAILGALNAIASGSYASADPEAYERLPFNVSGASDLFIFGGQLVLPGKTPFAADLAINYDDPVARIGGRVREVGDLRGSLAVDTMDASGLYLHPDREILTSNPSGSWLRLGALARFDLRRGPEPSSPLVRRIPAR